ncbi:hypothetical protein HMPREF9310_01277 [Staphylococcus simulans ACS-120-V-Sch1]|uniref:hypothetical protein n=1 Tax=Staphylococcus simulans TaxID=1286 RepID=UPI0002991E53|nr:hypothetical protein [Staphylococcus simulans]EKS26046.1 hypothetical protein HMPREF9310_01277 [Staphylococcus simulans ACS-120-V-Sch1]
MSKLKAIKIALLIVILAEEIRNARNYKKAIGKPFKVNESKKEISDKIYRIRKNQIDFLKTL